MSPWKGLQISKNMPVNTKTTATPTVGRRLVSRHLVMVKLILSATASILSRFCEPKVQGFLKGMPGGRPWMMTESGLFLILL